MTAVPWADPESRQGIVRGDTDPFSKRRVPRVCVAVLGLQRQEGIWQHYGCPSHRGQLSFWDC